MKKALIIACFLIPVSINAATYYVATNGNDSNPGTLTQPWLTIQKGFSTITPGDILYIRGGTYSPSGTIAGGLISGAVANGKKGSADKMYNVFAYPGELPVLDCRNITNPSYSRIGILILSSDYWYIKGLEITRVDQYQGPPAKGGQGLLIQSGNNNKIEFVTAHHCGGPGLGLRDACEGNLFLNCDAYNNYDPYSEIPGDDADGFDVGFITGRSGNDRINTMIGCRAWSNSDDGFDLYQYPGYHGIYIMDHCWAWKNGYTSDGVTVAGDGNGFKLGADNNYPLDATVRRSLYYCIAYLNRQRGFSQESANVKMLFYNNLAYRNGSWGFSFYYYDTPDIMRNNISYKNTDGQVENQGANRVHDHNTWDSRVTLTDADFVSLDASQLSYGRKTDGSLPDIDFFRLADGSDLIDAGANVGFKYNGNAPEMGTFEYEPGIPEPDPVFISASVENAATSVVALNFDLDLNSLVVPAVSAFTVNVNAQSRIISSVTISGKQVLLNLATPVVFGDVITFSYTKPGSAAIQTPPGKQSAGIPSTPVPNNLRDPQGDNDPPEIRTSGSSDILSGFTGELDASATTDADNDMLTFTWSAPAGVPVSSHSSPVIRFLAPMVTNSTVLSFSLDVFDGTVTSTKTVPVNLSPYQPDLAPARIDYLEASSYQDATPPKNISDGDPVTLWSADGDNQWLLIKLSQPFRINHLEITFPDDLKTSSVFDIYASKDNLIWEPVMSRVSSCDFSGKTQVFEFPAAKQLTEYSYVKLVGHGTGIDKLNSISELRILGVMIKPDDAPKGHDVVIYPNPAGEEFNISVEEPGLVPDHVILIDLTGRIVLKEEFGQGIKNIKLPRRLQTGVYLVELKTGGFILYANKLLVNR